MCGIAGIFDMGAGRSVDRGEIERMISTLPHRGPDAEGVAVFPGGGFGHTRLSILDLRPESHQPFEIDGGAHLLTYNGEIFNYVELRAELERLGHSFHTTSDTEVVIRAYKEWGRACVERFNGMWAFAIHDRARDELFCSRDRFGIKPFYHATCDGQFLFASEAKALVAVRRALARPDYGSLSRLLRASIEGQTDESFFEGIYRLRPAHNLVVTRTGTRMERYWSYPDDVLEDISAEDAAGQLRELLTDAIRIRLRSDVPVGATLSGGLDSSALMCLLRTFDDGPFETFTASYPGDSVDEAPRAEKLARSLGMNPNLIPASIEEFLPLLGKVIHHLDGPTDNPCVLPLWNIMKEMRKKIVVCLEGQGADEVLGGYEEVNFPYVVWDRIRAAAPAEAWSEIRNHVDVWGWKTSLLWTGRTVAPWTHGIYRTLRGDEGIYSGDLAGLDARLPATGEVEPRYRDRFTQRLYREHSQGLRSLLQYGDSISMAHSIESRLPFMDYRIVELAFRLPGRLKCRNGAGKAVLRDAVRPVMPDYVLERRRKLGFVTPIERWFRDRPEETVFPILLDETTRRRGLFDPKRLEKALKDHQHGRVDLNKQIFRWLGTELWFREFIDGPGAG